MTTETATTTPHLFRCYTCLEVYAFDGRYAQGVKCVCGGNLQYVGQVNNGRVIYRADAPACNYLCGDALGKACDCQCGGVNHGRHRMRKIVRDAGGVPQIENPDVDACCQRAAEIKAATDALRARVYAEVGQETVDAYRAGGWISDRNKWEALNALGRQISAAMNLKSHGGRLARLAK